MSYGEILYGNTIPFPRPQRDDEPPPIDEPPPEAYEDEPDVAEAESPSPDAGILRPAADFLPASPDLAKRYPTGFAPVDRLTRGGIPSGKLVVLVGPPGTGKTTLGAQMSFGLTKQGCHVAILPMDEGPEAISIRLGQMLGFDRTRLEAGNPDEIIAAATALAQYRIKIADPYSADATFERFLSDFLAELGDAQGVLVLDSAQTITISAKPREGLREGVKALVDRMLLESRRNRLIILLCSQANRAFYRSRKPSENSDPMTAGSETSALEYRPDLSLVLTGKAADTTVFVPKNRLGIQGDEAVFHMRLDSARATYRELEIEPEIQVDPKFYNAVQDAKKKILAALRKNPGISGRQVREFVRGNKGVFDHAMDELEAESRIIPEPGPRNAILWKLAVITPPSKSARSEEDESDE